MMRALLLIAVLGFILLVVGVLHYRSSQNDVTITIDKQKARETTEQVIEKGKELGSKIAEQAKGTLEKSDGSAPQAPARDR
jgi:hypothetical protein